MQIHVIFLGPGKDLALREDMMLEVPEDATIATVREQLELQCPALQGKLEAVRFAVNNNYALDNTTVCRNDEIAMIPPVSGGQPLDTMINLLSTPIDVCAIEQFLGGDTQCGGQVTFVGMTRAELDDEHGQLIRLDYEAYEDMAKDVMLRLAEEARKRWMLRRIAVVHRVGSVALGELAVFIGVAAGHRTECFDACRWLIDTLKRDVPIWKKDVFEDGYVRWSGSPHVTQESITKPEM